MMLHDLQSLVGDLQALKQIINNDFGGIESFRQALKRMQRFDDLVQEMGGVDQVRKRLEKLR